MRNILYIGWVLICATATLFGAEATVAEEILTLTKDVQVGTLENGITYYLQENDNPKEVIDLRLVVKVGSVYEKEYQRGLAHFVEHMGFNGTARYPGNQIIAELELLGASFGADLNAYTSFDETVYMLQLTNNDPQIIEKGLRILQQWAFEIEFEKRQIRKERGVVLEEERIRRSARQRIADRHVNRLFRGTRYEQKLPIGRTEVIRGARGEDIRAFYREWYRPERMAIIAVGAIDLTRTIAQIAEIFESPVGTSPHYAALSSAEDEERALKEYRAHDAVHISIAYDPEVTSESATLYLKRRPTGQESVSEYKRSLRFGLLSILLNRRFQDIGDLPHAALRHAALSFGFYRFNHAIESASLSMSFAQGRAREAIESVLSEIFSFAEYGAGEQEYVAATRELSRLYEQYQAEYPSQESEIFTRAYTRHFLYGELLLDVEAEVELAIRLIEEIDPASLMDDARLLIEGDDRFFSFTGILPTEQDAVQLTADDMRDTFERVHASAPTAPAEEKFRTAIIDSDALSPMAHVTYAHDAQLDIHRWQYPNGITVTLKENDYNEDTVHFDLYSRGGASRYDGADYYDATSATEIIAVSGVHDVTPSELRRYLSDKQLAVVPYIRQFTEGIEGTFSITDIDVFGELLYAYFSLPRIDEIQVENWRAEKIEEIQNKENDPLYKLLLRQAELLTSNNMRTRPLTADQVARVDVQNAFRIYQERFARSGAADFTLVLTGNISPQQLETTLARYIANLPTIAPAIDAPDSSERAAPPVVERERWKVFPIEYPGTALREDVEAGISERGIVSMLYFGEYEWGLEENSVMGALAAYMDTLLNERIRENTSAVYNIGASVRTMRLPSDRFALQIFFGSSPERLASIIAEVEDIVSELRVSAPSAEEVTRIQETQRSQFARDRQTNEFWILLLRLSDLYQFDLADGLARTERINALKGEDILRAAQRYLHENERIIMTLVPERASAESE